MPWTVLLAMGLAALAVGTPLWGWTRYAVTVVHEAGHALVAQACGSRGVRVSLHVGASGMTDWEADEGEGPLAQAAGYPAPTLAGLAALAGLHWGSPAWVLWGALVVLGGVLLIIGNAFGSLVLVACAVLVYAELRYAPPGTRDLAAQTLAWVLLAGGVRSAVQDAAQEGSDCELLRETTGTAAGAWYALFNVVALAGLGAAAYLTTIWW